jgi:hypothetical protein
VGTLARRFWMFSTLLCLMLAVVNVPLIVVLRWNFEQQGGSGALGAGIGILLVVFWTALTAVAGRMRARWDSRPPRRQDVLTVGPEGVVVAENLWIPFKEMAGLRVTTDPAGLAPPSRSEDMRARGSDTGGVASTRLASNPLASNPGEEKDLHIVMQVPASRVKSVRIPAAFGLALDEPRVRSVGRSAAPGATVPLSFTLRPWMHEGDLDALRDSLTTYAHQA